MEQRNVYDVGVVGLGYVGLTLATALAEVGYKVLGIERREDIVAMTNSGQPHFAEPGLPEALHRLVGRGALIAGTEFGPNDACDVYIITVGTPLNAQGVVRLDMIEAATREVADNMRDGALVILRSTVKLGTTKHIVAPILRTSGKSFHLAMCPERTLEGRALQELRQLPQIIGANDPEAADRAAGLFSRLTNTVVRVGSAETAEIIKLVDNTYRDVTFAFANEVARICDAFGVSANEVIASGKLGYPRTNVPLPGLVGGPCLEKDPHILIQSALEKGVNLEITSAGRQVNERQPGETVAFVSDEMDRRGHGAAARIAVLGMAFKGVPATDDLRGSMSIKVLEAIRLARPEAEIVLFDPVIEPDVLRGAFPGSGVADSLEAALTGAAVAVIANSHPAFGAASPVALGQYLAQDGFIYDYWSHFSAADPAEFAGAYFAVGSVGVGRGED
jgi:UDP-N-acetyl-D-mannosaminuronic acid dehydrogenase